MKKLLSFLSFFLLVILGLIYTGCQQTAQQQTSTEPAKKEMSHADMLSRGRYLVSAVGCNDCHSPKVMTPMGPVPDSTKLLSGYHANPKMPPIDKAALKPGGWILFTPDLTGAVGPWGMSFSANLTPDSTTGLGAWTEDVFLKTIRTGKHLGQEGGRPILPPMPWQDFAGLTDEDLKSIFTYLQSLPPVVNKVPAPLTPPDIEKMK